VYQNHLVHGYQKNILSTSQKKEDIKKDEQIKIKILKSLIMGCKNIFIKTKKRDFSKPHINSH
jgi:hypothetical protein